MMYMKYDKTFAEKIYYFIATLGYIGLCPLLPGTIASLVAIIALYFIPSMEPFYFMFILQGIFVIGTIAAERTALLADTKDPSFIVVDELLGMWISVFAIQKSVILYVVAFILFRFFDMTKISIIAQVEKKVPGGLGIMVDDIVAGFFTCIIMQGIQYFFR